MLENNFQAKLKKELKKRFAGCLVIKLDSADNKGIPDLLILYKNKWDSIECKKYRFENNRHNQEY